MNNKEWKAILIDSLVIIEWGDAWSRETRFRENDCTDLISFYCGWIVDKTKHGLKLCTQKVIYDEFTEYKYECYVPKGMVKSIKVLRKNG